MSTPAAFPLVAPPRDLSPGEAAAHCGIPAYRLGGLVAAGKLPQPARRAPAVVYDRQALDDALAALEGDL